MSRNARTFATVIAIVAIASLVADYFVTSWENPGSGPAGVVWRMVRYFTILTNAIVAVVLVQIAVKGFPSASRSTAVTLWIAFVGSVYYGLLARPLEGLEFWSDLGLHAATPLGMVTLWLIWAPKDGLRARDAFVWALWPVCYAGYALVRGAFDGEYPYFFLDPVKTGWAGIANWVVILFAGFSTGGLGMIYGARIVQAKPGSSSM